MRLVTLKEYKETAHTYDVITATEITSWWFTAAQQRWNVSIVRHNGRKEMSRVAFATL